MFNEVRITKSSKKIKSFFIFIKNVIVVYINCWSVLMEIKKKYKKSIFIFRRDLRLDDNSGLIEAFRNSEKVFLCFMFTPEQIGDSNKFKSERALKFMVEGLRDLELQIKSYGGQLHFFYGKVEEVLKELLSKNNFEAIYLNKDYTPYSKLRDGKIKKIADKFNIDLLEVDDFLLNSIKNILSNSGKPFSRFSFYYKIALVDFPKKPILFRNVFKSSDVEFCCDKIISRKYNITLKDLFRFFDKDLSLVISGGRGFALKLLSLVPKIYSNYGESIKDIKDYNSLKLSAYIKFGIVSIREVFFAAKKIVNKKSQENLIRQLYWHDFFYYIANFYPKVFGHSFSLNKWWVDNVEKKSFASVKKDFKAWCDGKTGFPFVDAAMRQLNEEGFLHNRLRLVVASFLTQILLIDWRLGERYFAQKLIDYDPSINNGNWQWVAGIGTDYYKHRIFNPWLQQKKLDKDCKYIKFWIPELRNMDNKIIHKWFDNKSVAFKIKYLNPIVNFK